MSDKIIETSLEVDLFFDKLIADNVVIDLYITDIPYPFDNQNGTGRMNYISGSDEMYERITWDKLSEIFNRMFKLSKKGSRAYIFCNRDGLFETKDRLEKAGWTFRNILVWDKMKLGGGYHWRNAVEYILYVSNDKPKVLVQGAMNIFHYKKPTKKDSDVAIGYDVFGTSPKPHQIWTDILKNGSAKDDVCCDPFAGTNPMKASLLLNEKLLENIAKAYTNVYLTEDI